MNALKILAITAGLTMLAAPARATSPAADSLQLSANITANEPEQPPPPLDSDRIPLEVSWGATFASKYLFLGVDLNDKNPVLQPELSLGLKNFSFTFWFNHDLDRQKPDELDFIVQYAFELPGVSIAPGYAYYHYPNRTWDPTQELIVDFEVAAPLSPSLSVHHDFDAGTGTYVTLGVSQGLERMALPLALAASVFYQNGYYDQTGFPAAELNMSASHSVGSVEFSPGISYYPTWSNRDFRGDARVPDNWVFSLNIAQSF